MIVEIFGNADECWQRLLNALQTARAADAPRPRRILFSRVGTSSFGRALA
jgi:hypothetical protein